MFNVTQRSHLPLTAGGHGGKPARLRLRNLIALSLSMIVTAGCASQQLGMSVEQYITERSREWAEAYATGKAEVMDRILADDFIGTSPRGERFTKGDAIRSAKGSPGVYLAARLAKIDVRVFGNAAVAFGEDVQTLRSSPPVQERSVWTDTWVYRNGAWQVIASQEGRFAVKSATPGSAK